MYIYCNSIVHINTDILRTNPDLFFSVSNSPTSSIYINIYVNVYMYVCMYVRIRMSTHLFINILHNMNICI
jgi:hypothetical protein